MNNLERKIKLLTPQGEEIDFDFDYGAKLIREERCLGCDKQFTKQDILYNNFELWGNEEHCWIRTNRFKKWKDSANLLVNFEVRQITHKDCLRYQQKEELKEL